MSQSGIVLPTTSEKERREELAAEYERDAQMYELTALSLDCFTPEYYIARARYLRARAATLRKNAP